MVQAAERRAKYAFVDFRTKSGRFLHSALEPGGLDDLAAAFLGAERRGRPPEEDLTPR